MDYKWNVYTADIKFEYNKTYSKRFKKYDNWIEHECSVSDFENKRFPISILTNSEEVAYETILERIDSNPRYIIGYHAQSDFVREGYETRNRIITVRKMAVTIENLLKDYNSENVIEYFKEREISTVMIK